MFKFLVVGEVVLPQQLNNFPVPVSSLSWQTGFSNRSEQNEYLVSSPLLTVLTKVPYSNCLWTQPVTDKLKCPYWNRITKMFNCSNSILAVKQYPQHYYLMAKLTASCLSTSGWLMALRETPSERWSSFSKQTCIPLLQTCLTSACSWHPTSTYLLTATMQSSTSV